MQVPKPCVIAIGKFESIHLGHQALIAEMVRIASEAQQAKLATALLVFEPHPYRVLFDPGYKPLLTSTEREYLVSGLGVDYLLEYPFDRNFAALSPEQFCQKLFNELQAQVVVVGEGYRFGHKRAGTVDTLRQLAEPAGARVHVVSTQQARYCCCNSDAACTDKTSTSVIRGMLAANKLKEAESLLGYPFFVMEEAMPGHKSDGAAGFPVVDIYPPKDKFLPNDGTYATRIVIDGRPYKSVTEVIVCPAATHNGRIITTHLYGVDDRELYGKQVRVEFMHCLLFS